MHRRPRCRFRWKNHRVSRPQREGCRHRLLSALFKGEKACTSIAVSALSPTIVHSRETQPGGQATPVCSSLSPQTSLCGVGEAAGLLPGSWILQDTTRSIAMLLSHRFGISIHLREVSRSAEWGWGTVAVWQPLPFWPAGLLCDPCISWHTCLKGVQGLGMGGEKPAPRWGFVGG